jgi:hypothetical protein
VAALKDSHSPFGTRNAGFFFTGGASSVNSWALVAMLALNAKKVKSRIWY